jgi:hypothetical protein
MSTQVFAAGAFGLAPVTLRVAGPMRIADNRRNINLWLTDPAVGRF